MNEIQSSKPIIIIGAGPAGLTAAYELMKKGIPSIIIEKSSTVGGLSQTVKYKGYHFDIGGHRFFTKVKRVDDMWREVLKEDFLKRNRLSRIYYKGKFFFYPIKPTDVVKKLGIWESFLCGMSYFKSKIIKRPKEDSFEDYIINNFGERLYKTFFRSYTEKVWGIPCTEIKAEWAAQRIKGLSFSSLLKTMIIGNRGDKIKSLIEQFYYPKYGPGMMWEKTREIIESSSLSKVLLNSSAKEIIYKDGTVEKAIISNNGKEETIEVSGLISSIPIIQLFQMLTPGIDRKYIDAANSLHYRDFITIALVINKNNLFPDNWIYVHDPDVLVGRIQNFNNWSEYMSENNETTCIGMEYFCFETDDIWNKSDKDLIDMAKNELDKIGLAKKEDVVDGAVVRMQKTYPVYDDSYEAAMPIIKEGFSHFKNLYPVGRNGMHRYNNQDHSMYTAMLAVENLADGKNHNLWDVNVERVYHEEIEAK